MLVNSKTNDCELFTLGLQFVTPGTGSMYKKAVVSPRTQTASKLRVPGPRV